VVPGGDYKFEIGDLRFEIFAMTYQRFEDLPVWQDAAKLYERVEILLELSEFSVTRGFRDQLDRASLSVSNNIAEGFERGTTKELLAFLYIARGSAGEVRSMLAVKSRRIPEGNLKSQISDLKSLAGQWFQTEISNLKSEI